MEFEAAIQNTTSSPPNKSITLYNQLCSAKPRWYINSAWNRPKNGHDNNIILNLMEIKQAQRWRSTQYKHVPKNFFGGSVGTVLIPYRSVDFWWSLYILIQPGEWIALEVRPTQWITRQPASERVNRLIISLLGSTGQVNPNLTLKKTKWTCDYRFDPEHLCIVWINRSQLHNIWHATISAKRTSLSLYLFHKCYFSKEIVIFLILLW